LFREFFTSKVEKGTNPILTLNHLEELWGRMLSMGLVISDKLLLLQFLSAFGSDYDTKIRMMASQRTLCRADVEKPARERYASLHQGKDSRQKNSYALVVNSSSQGKSQSHRNGQGHGAERKFNGGRKTNTSNYNPKRSEIPCERCGKHGHKKPACP
ncbi:unnamed protein product, partial [Choristocarpus tenellus]